MISSRNEKGLGANSRSENLCCCSSSNAGCPSSKRNEDRTVNSSLIQIHPQTTLSSKSQHSKFGGFKANLDTLDQQATPSSIARHSVGFYQGAKPKEIQVNGRLIPIKELVSLCEEHSSKCEAFSRQLQVRSANPYQSIGSKQVEFAGGSARGPSSTSTKSMSKGSASAKAPKKNET